MNDEINAKRERFVAAPMDTVSILQDGQSSAVAYLYEMNGRPYAVGFGGRRCKPDYNYRFRSHESRAAHVQKHFETLRANEQAARERKAARKAAGRGLDVGDVLHTSWGYEQTNVDYYQVTSLIGKTMVELREIAADRTETGWLQGTCTPVPDAFVGPAFRRVAKDGACTIDQVRHAWKLKRDDNGDYRASHWSSYY
ncbi:MAG: hypothetical protein F4X94_01430 [Dehalococcoidia bacterium]|nr:hypothetical protein [Pseudomonadota bacterium]MYA61227.1 hypothetical protein [Dehalococcoidia bacterium]